MGIRVECERCGHQYHLKDELSGKKVKCKICKAMFTVPFADIVKDAPGGGKIVAHAPRSKPFELPIGNDESISQISDHIQQHYGKVEIVWHEILSDLVHIDVHWVQPSESRPYHALITSGMSDRPMTVPEGAEAYRYGEMMICLPPTWQMSEEAFKDEGWYWPIRWLKILARSPHEYDTWLTWGHTIPNEDPPVPFAENTKLCCALILSPVLAQAGFTELKINDDKTIRFYALIPIYREEMDFKLQAGLDPLIERFDKQGVNEVVDVSRPNVSKKKGWW